MTKEENKLLDEAMELCEATFRQATGTDLKLAQQIIDLKKRVAESRGNTDEKSIEKPIKEKIVKKEPIKETAFGENISEPII